LPALFHYLTIVLERFALEEVAFKVWEDLDEVGVQKSNPGLEI